ncbi:MAG: TonB-dependent receptor [Gemmatimonadales bacterium]
MRNRYASGWYLVAVAGFVLAVPGVASAQSLTSGSLRGVVRDTDGTVLRRVDLTLEGRLGGTISRFETDLDGTFRLGLMRPGEYQLLVEQQGFQPVRLTGIMVSAGEQTRLDITLERRPPPIERVEDVPAAGARVGTVAGRLLSERELSLLDYRRGAADVFRGVSEVVWPADGRNGNGLAAAGLPIGFSRLMIDGIFETSLGHLGLKSEPAPLSALARDGLAQMRMMNAPLDTEWRGALGPVFATQTASGTDRLTVVPFAKVSSATLGGRAIDNPLEQSATSVQAGALIAGAIVPDTTHFLLRFDYQALEQPTAWPFERDTATFGGAPVSLREALPVLAQDSFGIGIGPHALPAVRSWRGASGMGKLDWMLSGSSMLAARFSASTWKEETPQVGDALSMATGSTLDGRDLGAAIGITTSTPRFDNELRAGFSTARRKYLAPSLPETRLLAEGAAFGGSSVLPAFFDVRTIDIANTLHLRTGAHQIKAGAAFTSSAYQYDYLYGAAGIYRFADLDHYGDGVGSYYRAEGSGAARFSGNDIGLFVQDAWNAAPDLQLVVGLRWDFSPLPKNQIALNTPWLQATGIRGDSLKNDYSGVAPRVGFVWDVRGGWVLRGGLGLHYGRLDPTVFGEAITNSGTRVVVRRGIGSFPSWPLEPDDVLAPIVGPALTIVNSTWRAPRASKGEMSVSRVMRGGLAFHLVASYQHTDFLMRREDLNLAPSTGTTQEGRPIFGTLDQQAGFVFAVPGSNRRFSDFDRVSGLSPLGSSDHYEITGALEREVGALRVHASYTYASTRDNLVGARSLDPADQLSPFPDGVDGVDWDEGRSDFDVPHRIAATAEYRSPGSSQLAVAARYRVRSGLPFTPGFRAGVDINGDGAGGNDPVFLGGGLVGLQEALIGAGCSIGLGNRFAARNSCREKMQQGLDLHASIGIPVGGNGPRLRLEVDAFNVVATETGIIDRAAVLVDPNGAVVPSGGGNVNVPLMVNPRFGSILARRGEPRMVRVGLRMEY